MISKELIEQLKIILKNDFELDLTNQEVEVIGSQLVASYETLINLYISKC